MKKITAITAFGSGTLLAAAMNVSKQFISQLPDELPEKYADWIRGAALRKGVVLDDDVSESSDE